MKVKIPFLAKTWERCKSFSSIGRKGSRGIQLKSKSWPRRGSTPGDGESSKRSNQVVPEGCFSIYVGQDKQRFVIKTEYVNHPLFRKLLEEAESEYGYSSEGPLILPCEVDEFMRVLMEMDCEEFGDQGCSFVAKNHSSYHKLTPPRLFAID